MIYRRPYGEPVRPGINLSANEHYADLVIATSIVSLYLRWDKARRRPVVNAYRHFGWPPVIGPWKRIADMRREIDRKEREILALEHALHQANERYDKIRETNLQLRDALALYRNA